MNEHDKLCEALQASAAAQLEAAKAMIELAKATQANADATNRLMDQVLKDEEEEEDEEDEPTMYLSGKPR